LEGLVVVVVLLLLVSELLLEVLLPLELPDVVDEGLVLSPPLLLLLPLPVFVLLPSPVTTVFVPPAPWLDGIIDGSGVLPLLSVLLSLLPLLLLSELLLSELLLSELLLSELLLSGVVGGPTGRRVVLLSLLSLSLLLPLPSRPVDAEELVVLPSLLPVVSSLDFKLVVLPPLLLLSPTATVGVVASEVDICSDLCLFLVLLVSCEAAVGGGGGHLPFTDKEPSGHGTDNGVTVLLPLVLPLSVLLSLCLLLSLLSVLVSSVVGGKAVRVLLLALSVLLTPLLDGIVSLLFVASSGGGIVGTGKRHFPFIDKEPSGHRTYRGLRISLLPPSALLLPAWLLEGVDVVASEVDLSSDLFFFAAKAL
jgi:hypothetical protein